MVGFDDSLRQPGAIIQHAGWRKPFTRWKLNCCLGTTKQWWKLDSSWTAGVQRFNRFVNCVSLQSWLIHSISEDVPVGLNDVQLLQRLQILNILLNIKRMLQHSFQITKLNNIALQKYTLRPFFWYPKISLGSILSLKDYVEVWHRIISR